MSHSQRTETLTATEKGSDHARLCLPVQGMHCAGCAQSIERALSDTPGVAAVSVSHPLAQADVQFDPQRVSLAQIDQAVTRLGFSIPTEKARFAVRGMTCTGCADAIRQTLSRADGVAAAEVSFAQEEAVVEFLPGQANLDALQERVAALGYELDAATAPAGATPIAAPETSDLALRQAKLTTALACSAVLFALNMVLPRLWPLPLPVQEWTAFALAAVVQIWVGSEFHVRAWRSVRSGHLGMDVLVSLGSNVAFLSGLATLALNLDRLLFPLYFESAAFIITFVYLGRFLEMRTRRRTGAAIQSLMSLQPTTARVVRRNETVEVPLEQVRLQDTVAVRAGETVPVDGEVVDGASTVDESMLSGESLPVYKQIGDKVWGGTANRDGAFRYVAQAVGSDTAAARIADAVRNALLSKAPVQSLADRIARVFVPIVLGLALLSGLLWGFWGAPLFYPQAAPASVGLLFAAAVLLISCPCALGLATPTAMIAGTSAAARLGILVKNAAALQQLARVDTVVFDKTGTVTEGQLAVQDTVRRPAEADNADELLAWAASAAQGSAHPVSLALGAAAAARGLSLAEAEDFRSQTGLGVTARVSGETIRVGSQSFMEAEGLDAQALEDLQSTARARGWNVTFAARNERIEGFFAIADALRPDAAPFVQGLRREGLGLRMLSGDNAAAVGAMASQLELDPTSEVEGQVQPEGKSDVIRNLQEGGRTVCMVGDGVNDAPALAQADVGMALASGHNLALETADVSLLNRECELARVPDALALGRKVLRVVKQNLFWAFFYNVAAIPLAAGLFVPFLGPAFRLNPAVAAGAMALSSVFVVRNSLRLRASVRR